MSRTGGRQTGFQEEAHLKRREIVTGTVSILLILAMIIMADPYKMGEYLIEADYVLVAIVILLYLINVMVKSGRWCVLLRAAKKLVPFRWCTAYFAIGQAFNNIIPGRVLGEASRIYALHSGENIDGGSGLATIVTERTMDLVLITLMAITALMLLFPELIDEVRWPLVLGVGLAVALNCLVLFLLSRPKLIESLGAWLGDKIQTTFKGAWGERISNGLKKSTRSFNISVRQSGRENKKMLGIGVGLTVLIWLNEIVRLYLIIMALGETPGIVSVVIASSLATLSAVVLTAGSGNVVVISAIFTASGVSLSTATTAGILMAMTSIWLSVPIGVIAILLTRYRNDEKGEDLT